LTTVSITWNERKCSWTYFFDWVKHIVPSFNLKSIVTDGATYIDSSFTSVLGSGATHVVCWWHQRQNVMKKIGFNKRALAKTFLKITHAPTNEIKQSLADKCRNIASQQKIQMNKFEKLLKNCMETSLTSFKVFTGGTVTNSYSECINSLLRDEGMNIEYPMLTILRYLQNFSVQHYNTWVPSFTMDSDMRNIIGEDVLKRVTAGALSKVKTLKLKALKFCKIKELRNIIGESLKNCMETSLASFKVFTGGTVTILIFAWPL